MSEGVDLDGEVRRVDPDRWLASRFIGDAAARSNVIALYAFDHELDRAATATTTPMAAQIRLVWWRDTVSAILSGGAARRHPVADGLAAAIRAGDLPSQVFETMIEARLAALESGSGRLGAPAAIEAAQAALATLAALALGAGATAEKAAPSGAVWGRLLLRRAGRRGHELDDRALGYALAEARRAARDLAPASFPSALPATLARADLRRASPSDLEKRARLTWAALTGRL